MAFASASSITTSVGDDTTCYDVFLSFRGEDTRDSFTDHLYHALRQAGFLAFRDNDEIDRGQELKPEIEKAIKASKASIVVLSLNYATSAWCLDELWLILVQKRERNHFVLPIFYHVDPSDVRNQKQTFEIKVKTGTKWTYDNVRRWKIALTNVANLTGFVLSGPETKFLKEIVDSIYKELDRKEVHLPPNLTGMDSRYEEITSWLCQSKLEYLAICGMGGSGKTTLAKYIYNSNWKKFENTSFVENIGRRCKESHDLLEPQKQLLKDILGGRKRKIPSVSQGTCKIEEALQTKRTLIVLDDIVEERQLVALLGTGKINAESKIIITTENLDNWFRFSSTGCQQYTMKLLNDDESVALLSRHAFGSAVPKEGFEDLVVQAVKYCEGNPLALEVLGSSLYNSNTIPYWKSQLGALTKDIHSRIQDVLERGYHLLPCPSEKELFLHIACFFVGKDMNYVEKILEPDYSALSGIKTLSDRCLLSVSPNNKLLMHRLLQEMGRNIVREESVKHPVARSRVWLNGDSYKILKRGKGSESIEGLTLDMKMLSEEERAFKLSDLKTDALQDMDKLKLLQLNFVELVGPHENFSEDIRWLCWFGFHLRTIPSGLYMGNIVAIDMSYSNLEVFEPPMVLHSLKILNLKDSHNLFEIRNISWIPHLETLILWNCHKLVRVCEIGELTSLAQLNLTRCTSLCEEQESMLVGLKASSSGGVKEQPPFSFPHSLQQLFLNDCNLECTDSFPLSFSVQPFLRYLNLSNGLFEFLPCYDHLINLRVLDLSFCSSLKCLSCLPNTLAELYIYYCKSLEKITFQSPRFMLQEFGYEGCINLVEIEGFIKLLPISKLDETDLGHLKWLKKYQSHDMFLVGDDELTIGRSLDLQMLYEFNIMSTSLPDVKDSKAMAEYISESPSLSFHMPLCPKNRRLKGLNITFKYTLLDDDDWAWFAKISTTNGVDLMYNPKVFGKPESGEVGIWLSYWPIGSTLHIGDTVTVSIAIIGGLEVHECGVTLVYTDDEIAEETLTNNMGWEEILGGDLSRFQLSTGAYYLCRRDFFELMEVERLTPDWFRILVGDTIDYTEVQGWRKTGRPKHSDPSFIELKTVRCIIHGPGEEEIYNLAEMSKSSLLDKTIEFTSSILEEKLKSGATYETDVEATKMGTDVAEAVEKQPSPCEIKVHSVMCMELMKVVDRIDKIFPEIEAAIPQYSSGIQSVILLNSAIDKAKSLVRNCSESSKLYLALTDHAVLSRCEKSKKLLEQILTQIQNKMVPVKLASKISQIIAELREMKLSLDPSEEEAGKVVRSVLEGYDTGNRSGKESHNEFIRVAALKLHITSQKDLLMERRSIKKLLKELGEGDGKQPKKQILLLLLALLTKYGKSITSGNLENDNVVQNQDYKPRNVDFRVHYEEPQTGGNGVPPEEFKCPISLKLMYDPVVIDSGQTFERMWIQKWFDEGHDVCPKTNQKLSNVSLTPNTAMKDLISRWCETHGVMLSDPCIQFSADANTWENSLSSVTSLGSMYNFQLPVDFSNVSLGSLDSSRTVDDTREPDVESLSQELDDSLPWEFQCKIVENLMTRLKHDDRVCNSISIGNLVGSVVKFLKVARVINDVKAQRIGCLLLLMLVGEFRNINYLSEDAYGLIAEFLESEVIEEALAIIEALSSHQNCRSEIASSGALPCIFKILDTQIGEIQTTALKILYNLTLTRTVRSLVVSSDLIPKLVTLSEDDSLSRYCIAILMNLCGNQDDKSIIAETDGCVSYIAKVLESDSCEEQEQALEILLSLCSQSVRYCRLVMDEGVIPAVVSISINGNDKGKAKAHEMLRLLREIEHEDHVEESPAADYDDSNHPNNLSISSRASRFLSKFSRGSKRKG